MKSTYLYIVLVFVSCNIKGVEDTPVVENDTSAIVESGKLTNVDNTNDFLKDTSFNFNAVKPADSVTLKSGVKIVFHQHGSGKKLKKFDVVNMNYKGVLLNGKVFESNEKMGKPIPYIIGLGLTFDAFDEALLQCVEGDKIKFTIPSKLAYGKKGRGNVIPPDSDLIYETDLQNKAKGEKTKSGVEVFKLLTNENGVQPKEGDKIELAYKGWIKKTGKLFDASAAGGKLYEFELGTGRAIDAWHETIAIMREGENVLIVAPAKSCYGSKGIPELVPPNSDLVYILEVKKVTKKE